MSSDADDNKNNFLHVELTPEQFGELLNGNLGLNGEVYQMYIDFPESGGTDGSVWLSGGIGRVRSGDKYRLIVRIVKKSNNEGLVNNNKERK